MRSLHLCWYFGFISICKIENIFNACLCMHPQSNTINLLMLTEQFVYYLDAGWKANFDCCLDTNPDSIWQCLSPSRHLPFLLMFLKYVTSPAGPGSLRSCSTMAISRRQDGLLSPWFSPRPGQKPSLTEVCRVHKLTWRASPEAALMETVTRISINIYLFRHPQNRMITSRLQSELPAML